MGLHQASSGRGRPIVVVTATGPAATTVRGENIYKHS